MTLLSSLKVILWGSPCSFILLPWVPLKTSLSSVPPIKVGLLHYHGWSLPGILGRKQTLPTLKLLTSNVFGDGYFAVRFLEMSEKCGF